MAGNIRPFIMKKKKSITKRKPFQLGHYKNINESIQLFCILSPPPKSRTHPVGVASRLIAMEINLESNSHQKQNYPWLYQDESQRQHLLRGCPLADTSVMWPELLTDFIQSVRRLLFNFSAWKCQDEKFIWTGQSLHVRLIIWWKSLNKGTNRDWAHVRVLKECKSPKQIKSLI